MPASSSTRGDLELVEVATPDLRLTFLPQVGGRLISLQAQDNELLWRNPTWLTPDLAPVVPHAQWPPPGASMGSWINLGGSKTWPAPQGWSRPDEWHGPPDPVLDSGRYDVEISADETSTTVALTSAPDPRTGVRVQRVFAIPERGRSFSETASLRNDGEQPVTWAAWEVTQIDTSIRGEFEIDVSDATEPVELLAAEGTTTMTGAPGRIRIPVQDVVAKYGFPNATGRLAWRRSDGAALVQDFEVHADADYPDGGSRAEMWLQHPLEAPLRDYGDLHPDAALVEMETLSPLTRLAPGDSVDLHLTWTCTPPTERRRR